MVEAVIMTAALLFGKANLAGNIDTFLVGIAVQHEAGGLSKNYRKNVAEVIRARVESYYFPDSVIEVLFQDGQFQEISEWIFEPEWLPDADTIEAVNEAFSASTCHGCEFYYNPELSSPEARKWFEYSGDVQYVFSITETSWGIEYETRFFTMKER